MTDDPSRTEALFFAAAEIVGPQDRAAFLIKECGDDHALHARVEALLASNDDAGAFLQPGAPSPAMEVELARLKPEEGGERIGQYQLLQQIGEGGFGTVWMAEQKQPVQRRVALKIIKMGMDTKEVVARFEQERQALALMDHPNIAKVFDAGATPFGRPYFVMELVRGIKITDYCDQASLPTAERLQLFIAVCQAVQHAHQKGIIHRDLKPSNILVTLHDGAPVPKVIDFGVAKATQGRLTDKTLCTEFEQMIGTPLYMAPEQAEMSALDIDTRTDIYALGVVLCELLTGRTPLDAETLAHAGYDEIRRMIREEEPKKPSALLATMNVGILITTAKRRAAEAPRLIQSISGDLDWIVMKALEKDRARRYDSATALAEDLRRHLNDEPVSAGRPGAFYRLKKLVRRNKVRATMAGILLVSTLAVLLLAVRHTAQMKVQRDYARELELRATAAGQRAESMLTREQLQRAEDFFAKQDVSAGLAYLAHVLRHDPGDLVTANRLLSALIDRSHFLPLFAPIRHESSVSNAEFSADGKRILTTEGRNAWLWDAETGRRLLGPVNFQGDSDIVRASLSPDGRRFVLTGIDSQVFDSETGEPVTSLLVHPDRRPGDLWRMQSKFSPDGSLLATVSTDWKVLVWNVATSQPSCPPLDHGRWVEAVAFSPDGRLLAGCTDETGRVMLWDVATGAKLADWKAPGEGILKLFFTRDGRRLLAVTVASGFGWFDVVERKPLGNPLKQSAWLTNVELSPDEKTILSSAKDGFIRRWDAATGQSTGVIQEHGGWARMQQSGNGARLASRTGDPRLWLWTQDSSVPLIAPRRLESGVKALDLCADGTRILTATSSGAVTVWQAALTAARPLLFPGGDGSCKPAMNSEGTVVITGEGDTITRWDAPTGRPLVPSAEHPGKLRVLAFSPDGSRFVSGGLHQQHQSVRLWDSRTGQPAGGPFPASGYVDVAFLSPDNKLVGVVGRSNSARVWNVVTGQPLTGNLGMNTQIGAFGGHGKWLVLVADTKARVWNLVNGTKEIGSTTSQSELIDLQESPGGDCFATTAEDGTARVWSFEPVQPLSPPLVHKSSVPSASFSRDGKLLATACVDGTARIWDWASGRMLTEPLQHREAVLAAELSPDARRLATGSLDHTVRVWDAASGRPLTEPLLVSGLPYGLQWSADGGRLFVKSRSGRHSLWQLPEATTRAPQWLAEWAEVIGGQRLDDSGKLIEVGFEEYRRFRDRAASLAGNDVYGDALAWFFATGPDRPIAPSSRVTAKEQSALSQAPAGTH